MSKDVQGMPKSREKSTRKRTQHDMINQEKKCSGVQLAEKVMGLHQHMLLTCPDGTLLDHQPIELHMSRPRNKFVWTFHTGN
jgi:hypothetical protein